MQRFKLLAVAGAFLSLSACGSTADSEAGAPEPWFVADPSAEGTDQALAVGDPMAIPPVDDPVMVASEEPTGDEKQLSVPGGGGDRAPTGGADPAPVASGDGAPPAATRLVDIDIERGDSMKLYGDWSGVPENDLLPDGGLTKPRLKAGQRLQLVMSPDAFRKFTDNREKARLQREREFLQAYDIESVKPHTISKGDSIWKLSKDNGDVPSWLLKRLNRNVDFEHMKLGDVVLIPTLRKVTDQSPQGIAVWDDRGPGPRAKAAMPAANQPVVVDDGDVEPTIKVAAPEPTGITIRVKAGETVRLLSEWSRLTVDAIRRANPQIARSGLTVDQRIVVPVAEANFNSFVEQRKRFHGEVARPDAPVGGGTASKDLDQKLPVYGAKTRLVQHRVRRGETLRRIATKYGVTTQAIRSANPDKRMNRLTDGDVLRVPVPRSR
jgi:LysM repeat protein